MDALATVLRREEIKEKLTSMEANGTVFPGLGYQELVATCHRRDASALVCKVCCERQEHPDLWTDKTKSCPKLIPFECTHGEIERDDSDNAKRRSLYVSTDVEAVFQGYKVVELEQEYKSLEKEFVDRGIEDCFPELEGGRKNKTNYTNAICEARRKLKECDDQWVEGRIKEYNNQNSSGIRIHKCKN